MYEQYTGTTIWRLPSSRTAHRKDSSNFSLCTQRPHQITHTQQAHSTMESTHPQKRSNSISLFAHNARHVGSWSSTTWAGHHGRGKLVRQGGRARRGRPAGSGRRPATAAPGHRYAPATNGPWALRLALHSAASTVLHCLAPSASPPWPPSTAPSVAASAVPSSMPRAAAVCLASCGRVRARIEGRGIGSSESAEDVYGSVKIFFFSMLKQG